MKKVFFTIISVIFTIIFYFYNTLNEFSNNLSQNNKVGTATDIYLIKFRHYPSWYSKYLFDKYERSALYSVAKYNPTPYLHLINFVYAIELKEDLNYSYIDRTYELEDILVCIGLDENRVKIYREHLIPLNKDQFFAKKYNSFKDDTVFEYCKNKALK